MPAMLCLLGCMMVLYNFLDLYFPTGNCRMVKSGSQTPRFRCIPPFFKGVGEPCFCVLQCEPHVFEPFLDSLFASLYAFPGIVEYHKVVGIFDRMLCAGLFFSFPCVSGPPAFFTTSSRP